MPPMKPHLPALALAATSLVATGCWASSAEIVSLTGKGESRPPQSTLWQEARIHQQIAPGHFVRTGDRSAMALLFEDKTQLRLSQNSMFQIKPAEIGGGPTKVQLRQGRAWTQSKAGPNRLLMETPSAIAAIQGTDWILEVAPDGATQLIVLHGEVRLYNEHGSLTVRDKEAAHVVPGHAPTKLLLLNPADRVQWVRSYRVDSQRFVELNRHAPSTEHVKALSELLNNQQLSEAYGFARDWSTQPDAPALPFLLLADISVVNGLLDESQDWLLKGQKRHPKDVRFYAQRARLSLLRGDANEARALIDEGAQRQPDALELQLANAELAIYEGHAANARMAYESATSIAPTDARGWHGLGFVLAEREHYKQARPLLEKALELDPLSSGSRGELATLLTQTHALTQARVQFDEALRTQPDDYVALTGLALLQLREGHTEKALDTLLRASVIEPRYARAIVYKAVAYYQLGRSDIALQTLKQASEVDPLDPLPHQLASLIWGDMGALGSALDEARSALHLLPYLKSLNPVATNQKGSANLGHTLVDFGLEDWARSYAIESFSPFRGASHLFLADRYVSRFAKQSELMQGFLTEPLAFGASAHQQDLLPRPGTHASINMQTAHSRETTIHRPDLTLNGLQLKDTPTAWFAEWLRVDLRPGSDGTRGKADNLTGAVGIKLSADLHLFAYANRFVASAELPGSPLLASGIRGSENRIDAGVNYQFTPTSQSWFKIGADQSQLNSSASVGRIEDNRNLRESLDLQWRHSLRNDDNSPEWTFGAEWARARGAEHTDISLPALQRRLLSHQKSRDQSGMLYMQQVRNIAPQFQLDMGLFWQLYRIRTDGSSILEQPGIAPMPLGAFDLPPPMKHHQLHPRIGMAYKSDVGHHWRWAYQQWMRPASSGTLAPIATAGISLDEQGVVAGGRLKRLRLQWEHEASARTFTSLFTDLRRIVNPGMPGNVQNTASDLNDLSRLRNRADMDLKSQGELLEEQPIFQQGRIHQSGAAINHLLTTSLASFAQYTLTRSHNTSGFFEGRQLPYIPRHRLAVGLTWSGPERLKIQTQAIYRSARPTTEWGSNPLPSGWDAAIKARWYSADRKWLLEGYALNMLKKGTATQYGILVSWRN